MSNRTEVPFPKSFAEDAVPPSDFPVAGEGYRDPDFSGYEKGLTFKDIVDSEKLNQFLFIQSRLLAYASKNGVMHWSSKVAYQAGTNGAIVFDDGKLYFALQDSTNVQPRTNPMQWLNLDPILKFDPNTAVIKDEDGDVIIRGSLTNAGVVHNVVSYDSQNSFEQGVNWLIVNSNIRFGRPVMATLQIHGTGILGLGYTRPCEIQMSHYYYNDAIYSPSGWVTSGFQITPSNLPIKIFNNNGFYAYAIKSNYQAKIHVNYLHNTKNTSLQATTQELKNWSVTEMTDAELNTAFARDPLNVSFNLTQVGASSSLPIGTPIAWFSPSIPTGYAPMDGRSFSVADYPFLAEVFPTGILPDLRGRVLKHVPDGRAVGTIEESSVLSHSHTMSHTHSRGTQEITGQFMIGNNRAVYVSVATGAYFSSHNGGINLHGGGDGTANARANFAASRSWTGDSSEPSASQTGSFGGGENTVANFGVIYIVRLG